MRVRLALPLALLLAFFGQLSVALADGPSPVPDTAAGPPTKVFVGMHIVAIRSLDVKAQSFFADLYLWIRFATTNADRAKQIEDKLEPLNGKFDSKDEVDRKQIGDQTYICYRVTGTFFFTATLANYPFDTQSLDLILENSNLESNEMVFVDDTKSYERGGAPSNLWGLQPSVKIPEFSVTGVQRRTSESTYTTDFGDPTSQNPAPKYSRFTASVRLSRVYLSYLFKIIIPLLVILAMAYLVFLLPAKEMGTASSIIITALLSCMAFNVSVSENMPEVGYLVLSDKFFIASYILLLFTLIETIGTYVIDARGREELALKIDRVSAWLFPMAVLAIFACVVLAR